MQGIQRPKPKLHSILTAAKKMARRYGQIGLDEPDDIVQAAMLKVLKRTDERPMPMLWLCGASTLFACRDSLNLPLDISIVSWDF